MVIRVMDWRGARPTRMPRAIVELALDNGYLKGHDNPGKGA
jgi:hypothetical protein